jgi:hypothetical protein
MIKYIFAHKLHIQSIPDPEKPGQYLNGAIYGGGYDQNGNPTGGPGFYLGTDGKLKAVNGEFSGRVNADSGNFNNITITGKSLFSGTIYSNALISTDEITGPGTEKTFSSGEGVKNVFRYYGYPSYDVKGDWTKIIDLATGSYGNYNDLIRIELIYKDNSIIQSQNTYSMILYFRTNYPVRIIGSHSATNPSIGNTLLIGGGSSGKTLRFIDIPTGDKSTYENGTVWKDNNGFLHIK